MDEAELRSRLASLAERVCENEEMQNEVWHRRVALRDEMFGLLNSDRELFFTIAKESTCSDAMYLKASILNVTCSCGSRDDQCKEDMEPGKVSMFHLDLMGNLFRTSVEKERR